MLSLLNQLEKSRSYRYFDDENEDDLEEFEAKYREFSIEPQLEKETKLTIVCEGKLASFYGQILMNEAKPESTRPTAHLIGRNKRVPDEQLGQIFKLSGCTLVLCNENFHMFHSNKAAECLMNLMEETSTVLCLTAKHESELRLDTEETGGCVRFLTTQGFQDPVPDKRLEQPNLISGLTASLLSLAAVKKMMGAAVINYVEVMTADSISLAGFQKIFDLDCVKSVVTAKNDLQRPPKLAEKIRQMNAPAAESSLYL